MDPDRKQRLIGNVSLIAVIVIVCGYWASLIPQAYKSYRRESKLLKTLQAIKPPVGANAISITTSHYSTQPYGTAAYSTDSGFDEVKTHYAQEFVRNGFAYKGEDRRGSEVLVHFCAPEYAAVLSTVDPERRPGLYIISINWKNASC